ncbi:MAG: ABC transporter ATP-binding protein [Acidimicrobiales bacterium]
MSAADPAVSFCNVSVVRGGRSILDSVDWEVGSTGRWVVLGPNGSGKTTLLQIAGGRLMPSRGSVSVLGSRFGRSDLRTMRGRVSLVSAATVRALRPFLTSREVVVTGRDGALLPVRRRYTDEDWAEVDDVLRRVVGFDAVRLRDAPFGLLSEGERQQVLIARSLMAAAELILLDEPASGLDLGARERLVTRMGALASDQRVPAMVLVTHHLEEVPPGFTHGLLIAEGRVLAAGRLEEVLTAQLVSACFGIPVHVEQNDGRWWAHSRG